MVAVDTNILVYDHRQDTEYHEKAHQLILDLASSQSPWAICFHSLVEFYSTVTRKNIWKQPTTPDLAKECILDWEKIRTLEILYESYNKSSLSTLLDLAVESSISGPMIHDTRIASCFLSHGITTIYTVDRDFKRFPQLKIMTLL